MSTGAATRGRPDVSLMGVLSGLEMALWDIVGKSVGKPVYELLGGKVHERLRSYTYLYPDEPGSHAYSDSPVYSVPQAAAERAVKYVEQGFTAVKFDPAGPYSTFDPRQPSLERLALSEAFCKTLREALGAKCDLLFGTHGQFTVSGALRLARRIEPYEPLWFEEPTPPEAPEEMARVARQCRMPIATGERLTTKYEFARVLETGAASILQMNLGRVGGLLEAKKIAAMAEAHYAQIAPHLYCGPIVGAANIQLATCSPNFLILESIERWDGFQAKLLKKPIRWEEGYVIPPERAGPRGRTRRGRLGRPPLGGECAPSRAEVRAGPAAGVRGDFPVIARSEATRRSTVAGALRSPGLLRFARNDTRGEAAFAPHPNLNAEIILPPILSLKSRLPLLAPAAPATTISGRRCSSRGWHWRAEGALSHGRAAPRVQAPAPSPSRRARRRRRPKRWCPRRERS